MSGLNLFFRDRFVGIVAPDQRNKTRVTFDVDAAYHAQILLSEAFATIPGRRPPVEAVLNFLGFPRGQRIGS